ncbi:putative ubiquitin hydrolase [Trypanosoma theileri]|uniref:Ubiquitin carboxyl-terminal hydrolase n=1 Tax=Trypanosoma theileri TaxID=67003 RepID=A0A1X0PA40_9TRYP|nr:putative ubiquitin hydrolase [Trypanosoma theileri]ORC93459.1 putative ubiquitin hydrolase [Trypanosoma theileri]
MTPPYDISEESCPHCWDESAMVVPHHTSAIHKEECAYCCRTCRHEGGILVCMSCHMGLCVEHVRKHISVQSTHAMFVWIKELPPKEEDATEETKDVNKLGVVLPKEYENAVCCGVCAKSFLTPPDFALECYSSIVHATSTGAKDAMDADVTGYMRPQCPHLICLEQLPSPFQTAPPSAMEKCSFENCDCRTNNWMCMTCGAVGCPRKEAGGSAHALQHYFETQHPVVVKLGTVTPSGADFYCYICDDEVSDVHFESHMNHFGIDVQTAKKTAKTLGEMQYDYSSQFDFNRITESGESLVSVFGPGRTGMHNFGNSCYMASVVQCLFALEPFREAFYHNRETLHQNVCRENPYNCRTCQTERVASGLLSGEFSKKDNERNNGITAREFKRVFAHTHPDFSSAEQQDAQEYMLYLLEQMRRYVRPPYSKDSEDFHPADIFKMTVEHRVQCSACHKVRYTRETDCCLSLPIPIDPVETNPNVEQKLTEEEIEASRPHRSLEACITSMMQPTEISCRCSACDNAVTYFKTTRLATFPDVLPVFLRRVHFDMETMSVKKIDVFIDVPETINFEYLRSKGLQADEVEMPSTDTSLPHKPVSPLSKPIDETALAILLSMGIEDSIARYALLQTGMNAERAIDYVFSREDIALEMSQASGAANTPEKQESTTARVHDGPATYKLHAMISHMGASAKTGHYVCHIRDEETGKWLLFNDEKVAESRHPPFSMASVYFYKRCAE